MLTDATASTEGSRDSSEPNSAQPLGAEEQPISASPPASADGTSSSAAVVASDATESLSYRRFYDSVAAAQLADWLPSTSKVVLDLSGPRSAATRQLITRGHRVLTLLDTVPDPLELADRENAGTRAELASATAIPGLAGTAVGDRRTLETIGSQCLDLVVAEDGALSRSLAAEATLVELHRVLRPRGRVLVCVDSLLSGLARLAEQGRWAELADSPAADVLLVEDAEGGLLRCFWPEELADMFAAAGLAVDWIRPRTVLTAESVTRALTDTPTALEDLVSSELDLAREHQGEALGSRLLVSARRSS